ncbi:MAG: efflux RND transporter periplasmic adaptor subunit [Thermoanaerobacterales bacterium]|nr:efflux RND transporter periplasmic adaptor subunit [Thermoanaerobacterales bacterium]
MQLKRRWLAGLGLLILLAAAALAMTTGGTEVETVEVRPADITRTVADTGYVQPVTDRDLYTVQGGQVAALPVEAGQAVKEGQTLAVLENPDLAVQLRETEVRLAGARAAADAARSAIERTELELNDARANLARVEELLAAGAAARVEYEQARLRAETLEKALQEQEAQRRSALAQISGTAAVLAELRDSEQQLTVRSPVDGIVLRLPVKKGDVLPPGGLVAAVAATGRLEVKVDILSDDLAEVKVGQRAAVTAPFLGQKALDGKVEKIYPQAEEKQSALGIIQRRVPVIVSLSAPSGLKPGFEVDVAIETLSRQGVPAVPREAVRTLPDGRKQVMAVVNGRIKYRIIETGISDADLIEVRQGLQAGDRVVRDGSLELKDGTRVK